MLSYLYVNALRNHLFKEHKIKDNVIRFVDRYQEALDCFYSQALEYLDSLPDGSCEITKLLHAQQVSKEEFKIPPSIDPFGYVRSEITSIAYILDSSNREIIEHYLLEFDSNVIFVCKSIYAEYALSIWADKILRTLGVFMLSAIFGLDSPLFFLSAYFCLVSDDIYRYGYSKLIRFTYCSDMMEKDYFKFCYFNHVSYYDEKYREYLYDFKYGLKFTLRLLVELSVTLLYTAITLGLLTCTLKYILTSLLSPQALKWLFKFEFFQGLYSSSDHPLIYVLKYYWEHLETLF